MARTKKTNSQTNSKPIEWLVNSKSGSDSNDEPLDDNALNNDDTHSIESNDNTITDMSANGNQNNEPIVGTIYAATTTSMAQPEIECDDQSVVINDICFIECQINGSQLSRQPSLMQNAFLSLKARKFNPKWIKTDEVMAINCFDGYMFVCDAFDGQLFHYLVGKNARIIGPLCVHYCSNESRIHYPNLPNKPYPVFSQCMRKLYVSITSFEGQRKSDLKQKIERMGANFVKDLTKTVTHLVSDSVRTDKYKVASKLGKTVLTSEWVDTCWQKYQYELCDANDKDIVDKYKVPIFKNLLVSASQVESQERDRIKELVEKNGGTYSGALKLTEKNTILLVKEPNGDKYKYAQKRSIPCLNVNWIYDCVDKGYALPEEGYAVTAAGVVVSPKVQEKHLYNLSLKRQQKSSQTFLNRNASLFSQTKSIEDIEMVSNKTLSNRTTTDSMKSSQIPSNAQLIESLKTLSSNEDDVHFLEGCILHIIGFDRTVIDTIKRAVCSRGSIIMENFLSQTSHVIVGPNTSKSDIDSLQTKSSQNDSTCKFVTIDWIFDCFHYKELCDHNAYEINESSFKENRSISEDSMKIPSNIELPESSRKALEKLSKTLEINKSCVHKSLLNAVNEDTPIQWNDGISDGIPSQKPYSRTNSSEESVRETHLKESGSDVCKTNSSHSNDEITNNSDNRTLVGKASNELKSNSANNVEVATEVYVVENRSAVNEVIVDYKHSRSSPVMLTMPVVPIVPKVFMFSGYDDHIKAEFTDIVESLNESVVESDKVMETVTHLVVKNPSATEKVLSAIARGIWILRDEYLRESNNKRNFVCEEQHEWGTYLGNTGISKSDEKSVRNSLMLSATEWRKHLKNERKTGAFENWNVLILNRTNQTKSYSQILKCGKANVVYSDSERTCEQLSQFNYSFVDSNDYNSVSNVEIMKDLVSQQKLYKIDFISHYLINGPNSILSPALSTKLLVKELSNNREQRKRTSNRMEGSGRHSKMRKNIQ